MKLLLLLLVWIPAAFCSHVAVTENEPSALVEGIVNAVTGDLYALEDDIIIQGAEPLRLRRNYISAQGNGQWNFFEHLTALLQPPIRTLNITEPNGTLLIYRYELQQMQRKKKHKKKIQDTHYLFHPLDINHDAQGLTNTARGTISAHTNLKNQYVRMEGGHKTFTLFCPNGSKRRYFVVPDQKPESIGGRSMPMKMHFFLYYHLYEEELPNGNKIIYSWDKNHLLSIRTTDPTGHKTYAQATFQYHGQKKEKHRHTYFDNADFTVHTSDGRSLHYHHFCEGAPEKGGRWYLHQITPSDAPQETLHYNNRSLSAISLPLSRNLHIAYDSVGRVQTLSAPVGTDTLSSITHQFQYDFPKRTSTVIDSDGNHTHYHWNENSQLTSVERYSLEQTPLCSTHFCWGEGPDAANLLCRAFLDGEHRPLYATTYSYDDRGNILLEKFYGNLSGQGPPLQLDARHLPLENGVETYSKTYTYSQEGRNLLLRKEESSGLLITYDYLPDTDLPTAELSYENGCIKRRRFYEYNADRILVRDITDEGTSTDKNDLRGVTFRQVVDIHPKTDAPFLNMPHIIEEKSGDRLLKKTHIQYTTGGRIAKKEIYDASGTFCYSLTYKYDSKGNLIEETNALGQTAFSAYDELGNKIAFRPYGDRVHIQMHYDCSNRQIASTTTGDNGSRQSTRHAYDKRHNKILSVDPHGYQTHYVYNPLNQLIETHLPSGGVMRSSYDAAGCEVSHTDAKGYATHTTYNAYGKPTSIQHPDGTEEHFIYNLDGSLRVHTDPNGLETAHTYDVFGRITTTTKSKEDTLLSQETFVYNAFHLIAKIDAEGNTTQYEYDATGRKSAETSDTERTEFTYDALGRLYCTKQGELLSLTLYDLLDRPLERRQQDAQGNLLSQILYAYDDAGNLKTTTRFIAGQESTERYIYDPFHRRVKTEDPLGHTTTILYDDALNTRTTIDPLGLHTCEAFNAHGLVASLEKRRGSVLIREDNLYDANANLILKQTTLPSFRNLTTTWEYGPRDRLHTLTEASGTPLQKVTQYTYTPTGQLFQLIKPSGTLLTHTYSPLGHLASQSASDGTLHYTYLYNRLGQLVRSSDTTTSLTRTYDPQGRLLTEQLPNALTLHNTYDSQGRRIRLDLPDGSYITYTYDPLHLRHIARYRPSQELAYVHTYTDYDTSGHLLSQRLIHNLGTVTSTYDIAARPTSLVHPSFSHEILEHDPVGNVLRATLHKALCTYTYDDLYQLTSENAHTYAHDPLYNRYQKDNTAYTINALNQLPQEFHYNADGNPSQYGDTHYTYDALDRLIALHTPTQKFHFTYDSYHRRLSKTRYTLKDTSWHRDYTQYFLYDGNNEIGSLDETGTFQELRVLGLTPHAEIGSAIAIELNHTIYAPLHDLYGNVALLLSSSEAHPYHYTAFGEEQNTHPNPWRFSSKRTDDDTHLVYFGRRYYIPSHGRWLTPDPLGFDAGPNLYAYVSNSPLTHVDPYGLFSEDLKQIGIGTLHGVGSFATHTASTVSTIGWGLTTPLRSFNWVTGRSTPSQDWNAHQRSLHAFHTAADCSMQRLLPANTNHALYHSFRNGVSSGLELGSLSAAGLAKGAYTLSQKGTSLLQKLARPSHSMTGATRSQTTSIGTVSSKNQFKHIPVTNIRSYEYHPRIRMRALQDPVAHNFPYSFDEVILKSNPIKQVNGTFLYRQTGTLNGRSGVFELGVNNESKIIFHRTFRGGQQ
jgi:RHS repeat-associated protein